MDPLVELAGGSVPLPTRQSIQQEDSVPKDYGSTVTSTDITVDVQREMSRVERHPFLAFFFAFLACTGAMVGVFLVLRSSLRATEGAVEFSAIADLMGATLGLSVALAGSAVALVLSVRALRQAYQSNKLSDQVAQLTKLNADFQRRREVDARHGEILDAIENLLGAGEDVIVTSRGLSRAANCPIATLPDSYEVIDEARAASAHAISNLARAYNDVLKNEILKEAWRKQALTSGDSAVIDHFFSVMRDLRANETRFIDSCFETANYPAGVLQDAIDRQEEEDGETAQVQAGEHPSRWWVAESTSREITSSEKDLFRRPRPNPEERITILSTVLRSIGAELKETSATEIWLRCGLARYGRRIQNTAIFDPSEAGGYHMRASDRKSPFQDGETEEQLVKAAEKAMLEADPGAPHNALGSAFALVAPILPLKAAPWLWKSSRTLDLASPLKKGGLLPKADLAFNYAGFILYWLAASVPDRRTILEAARQTPHVGADLAERLEHEPLDALRSDFLKPVMSAISQRPDQAFLPLPRSLAFNGESILRRDIDHDWHYSFGAAYDENDAEWSRSVLPDDSV